MASEIVNLIVIAFPAGRQDNEAFEVYATWLFRCHTKNKKQKTKNLPRIMLSYHGKNLPKKNMQNNVVSDLLWQLFD